MGSRCCILEPIFCIFLFNKRTINTYYGQQYNFAPIYHFINGKQPLNLQIFFTNNIVT